MILLYDFLKLQKRKTFSFTSREAFFVARCCCNLSKVFHARPALECRMVELKERKKEEFISC